MNLLAARQTVDMLSERHLVVTDSRDGGTLEMHIRRESGRFHLGAEHSSGMKLPEQILWPKDLEQIFGLADDGGREHVHFHREEDTLEIREDPCEDACVKMRITAQLRLALRGMLH